MRNKVERAGFDNCFPCEMKGYVLALMKIEVENSKTALVLFDIKNDIVLMTV